MSFVRDPRARHRLAQGPWGESLTERSHAEACDINFIVNRFARSGNLPPATREPAYADVTGLQGPIMERLAWAESVIADYQQAQLAAGAAGAGGSSAPGGTPTGSEPPTGSGEPG